MSGRVAMVTGGVGGIGTEICRTLCKAGYRVAATYIAAEQEHAQKWQAERKAEGMDTYVVEMDATDYAACQNAVQEVAQNLGPVDVLVNNAGITRDTTFKKMEPDQWNAVLSTNLDSVFNVTRQVINGMLDRKFGRIINISSINGRKGQFGQANYSAAKAGMHGFTMAVAQEVASKGITVNTVSPGYIGTQMVRAVPKEYLDKIVAQIPVGRLGEPSEIARLVTFLAADESGFITGANIDINGGQFTH